MNILDANNNLYNIYNLLSKGEFIVCTYFQNSFLKAYISSLLWGHQVFHAKSVALKYLTFKPKFLKTDSKVQNFA